MLLQDCASEGTRSPVASSLRISAFLLGVGHQAQPCCRLQHFLSPASSPLLSGTSAAWQALKPLARFPACCYEQILPQGINHLVTQRLRRSPYAGALSPHAISSWLPPHSLPKPSAHAFPSPPLNVHAVHCDTQLLVLQDDVQRLAACRQYCPYCVSAFYVSPILHGT